MLPPASRPWQPAEGAGTLGLAVPVAQRGAHAQGWMPEVWVQPCSALLSAAAHVCWGWRSIWGVLHILEPNLSSEHTSCPYVCLPSHADPVHAHVLAGEGGGWLVPLPLLCVLLWLCSAV